MTLVNGTGNWLIAADQKARHKNVYKRLVLVTVSSMSEILVVQVIFFRYKDDVDSVIDFTIFLNFVE